jgi:hypothetical protein
VHYTWWKALASSLLAAATSALGSGARVRDETISRRAADGGPAADAIAAIHPRHGFQYCGGTIAAIAPVDGRRRARRAVNAHQRPAVNEEAQ